MNDSYIHTFKSLDRSKLLSKTGVLDLLEENGEHEPSLAKISDRYTELIGIDPIWRYPITDDSHNGAFIVPVQEGYMWLPYDEIDQEYYEILLPEEATMLDEESCEYLSQQLREYTDELCAVFAIIQQDESQKEG